MRFFIQACFFIVIAVSTLLGTEPGSLGLIVENHVHGKRVPDILNLQLRGEHHCEHSQPNQMCKCWENLEGQPAVQGKPSVILESIIKPLLPHFTTHMLENGKLTFPFPSPALLQRELSLLGRDQFFKFYPDDSLNPFKEYLELIAEGKVPVAGLGNMNSAGNMQYHNYLHDAFNHVPYKILEPEELRKITQSHARAILNFQSELEQELADNEMLVALLHLTTATAAQRYDTAMGSLNNLLLYDLDFVKGIKSFSPEFIKMLCEEIKKYLNFGLILLMDESFDDKFLFPANNKIFLWRLYNVLINVNNKNFTRDTSETNRLIKSDPQCAKLSEISAGEFAKISEKLKEVIWQSLSINGSKEDPVVTQWFSFTWFLREVRSNFGILQEIALKREDKI